MRQLFPGKLRGLQQTAAPRGVFAILALDHRNNLRQLLHPEDPAAAPIDEMISFKLDILRALAPIASAVLLDPEWSAAQSIAAGTVPGSTGIVLAVEATGYMGETDARTSRILPGWSIAKSKRLGVNAVKLLVYYHPDSPTAAQIEQLVSEVAVACEAQDLALFLEPLSYSLDTNRKKLEASEHRRVVIETARRLTPLGADVLKAEFPSKSSDQREWREACRELSDASSIPWVLLSASVEFETYLHQVTAACEAGASGIAVGRAVWKEATMCTGAARKEFLQGIARERMARVAALVSALARPWMESYVAPPISPTWYETYGEER